MKNKKNILKEILTSQSIFVKIYGILIVAALGMVIFIMLWVNSQDKNNNKDRVIESNLSRIEAMDTGVNQLLDSTSQMMTQMMWSQDFVNSMITANSGDNERSYRMITQLDNCLRGETNILKNVYFCTLIDGKMMRTGSFEIQSLENAAIYETVRNAMEREDCYLYGEDREQGTVTYLVNEGDHIFLVQLFRLSMDPVGMMICEFDPERMADAISNDLSDPTRAVFIYDLKNQPLLEGVLDYSGMEAHVDEEASYITRENQKSSELKTDRIFFMESEATGIRYMLRVDPMTIGVSFWDTLKGSLPAILMLLLIVLGVNYYVVQTLYKPIEKLVDMVSDVDTGASQRGSAFEYLEDAYQEARTKEQEMKTTIDTLAPDLFETTLRKLLEGKVYRRSELLEILAGIHSTIPVDGRFVVCTCMIEEPGNRQVSEREWNLYTTSLQNLIQEMPRENVAFYPLRADRNQLVILMMFRQDTSAVSIKRECREICMYLTKNAEPLPYTLYAECGQIYNCLTDIHESFLESMERIRYTKQQNAAEKISSQSSQYVQQALFDKDVIPDNAPMKTAAESKAVDTNDRPYLQKNVADMIRASLKGAKDSALVIHHHLCDEGLNRYPDFPVRQGFYGRYLDEWAEQLSVYPLSEEELNDLNNLGSPRELSQIEDEEVLLSRMEAKVRYSCQILVNYGKTNRYKYVDQAKTYMEANFDNSDLALNTIAEHIGITASYLSELFAEVSGMKFSAALAELRVSHAKDLLRNSDTSIREIGEKCGFNSVQNFIRVFKKVSGYTPGQYRDMKND